MWKIKCSIFQQRENVYANRQEHRVISGYLQSFRIPKMTINKDKTIKNVASLDTNDLLTEWWWNRLRYCVIARFDEEHTETHWGSDASCRVKSGHLSTPAVWLNIGSLSKVILEIQNFQQRIRGPLLQLACRPDMLCSCREQKKLKNRRKETYQKCPGPLH